MMMHSNYRIDRYVADRQNDVYRARHTPHQPSALRIRTGLALISLGERLRGCTQTAVTPSSTPVHRMTNHGATA